MGSVRLKIVHRDFRKFRGTRIQQSEISAGSRRHRFDLVICDHVLQYFSPETQLEMLHSLATAVYPSAFLYASTTSSTIPEELTAKLAFTCLARSFYRKG